MAERIAPKKAVKRAPEPRQIKQEVVHVVEVKLDRRDGKGTLLAAVVDLGKGVVQLKQPTTPITFRGKTAADDVRDVIQFYTGVLDYIENAPESVLRYDDDEAPEAAAVAE